MSTPDEQSEEQQPAVANPLGGQAAFDYLTDVLIPLCILGMVGTFSYFLVELRSAYVAGGNQLLKYVLLWFLLAVVCLSRLRAKYGGDVVARPYALALAGAMGLFVIRFASWGGSLIGRASPVGTVLMLAVVAVAWWAIHRLTDECTVEEDREDESETGLLASGAGRHSDASGRRRRHPGRLVIVFGLVALTLFAVSQPAVEHAGPQVAHWAFAYMVLYLLCTLVLLALTSLSGLRLYVRQRGADLGRALSLRWLIATAVTVAIILSVAAAIPRGVEWGGQRIVRRLPEGLGIPRQELPVDSPVEGVRQSAGGRPVSGREGQEAGGVTAGPGGRGPGENEASGGDGGHGQGTGEDQTKTSADHGENVGNGDGEGGRGEETGRGQGEGAGDDQNSVEANDGDQSGQRGNPSEAGGSERGQQSGSGAAGGPSGETAAPQPSPSGGGAPAEPPDLRWLLWLAAAAGVAAALYALGRLIPSVGRFLRRLLNHRFDLLGPLRGWWARLIARLKRRRPAPAEPGAAAVAPLPANPLKNPFSDPALLSSLSPNQVVEHSYHALLAFAESKGCGRRSTQTPLEYLRGLPPPLDDVRKEFATVTSLYIEAAYTSDQLSMAKVEQLRPIWHKLEQLLS